MREAVGLLLDSIKPRCDAIPLNVRRNASFLVDSREYSNNRDDIKCDMNGVYKHTLRNGVWTIEMKETERSRDVNVLCKKKKELDNSNQYHLHINSNRNTAGLCRSIFFITDSSNQIVNDVFLLQYHHKVPGTEDVEFHVPSHGNRKDVCRPFYPRQKKHASSQ